MEIVPSADGDVAEVFDGVTLTQLVAGEEMSVQHYVIEAGAVVEEHDHHHEQAGYVIQGELTWYLEDETLVTEPGDSYILPGGEPHEVVNEGEADAIGIELFSPPRPDPPWLE